MQRGTPIVFLSASALLMLGSACLSTPYQDDAFSRTGDREGSGPCEPGGASTLLQPAGFVAPVRDDGAAGAVRYICEFDHRSHGGQPLFDSWDGNTVVINGGSTSIDLTFDLGEDEEGNAYPFENRGVILGVVGELGYYYRPIDSLTDTLTLDLLIRPDLPDTRSRYTLFVGINGPGGSAMDLSPGEFQEIPLDITTVTSGELQVSLSWDTAADLDLYVTEPNGERIFWGAPVAESGATLDLDGNAACEVSDERNENIFWPPQSASSGEYLVEIFQFDPCGTEGRTNWRVTVLENGEPTVYSGSLNPDDLEAVDVTTVNWTGPQ
jgi:hypothetical protein